MEKDLNKVAGELLNSPAGARLSNKKEDIEKLIQSPEGQSVKNMLSGDEAALKAAWESGDMQTLQKALAGVLKTADGAKLAAQIQNLMK